MEHHSSFRRILWNDTAILVYLALAKFLVHMITNLLGGYGYFRDELYYIACSDHLDLGYVDQPPLSIWVLAANRLFLGDSLVALRFVPAMVGSLIVFLTGLLAREMGGGRTAQVLAALASLVSLSLIAASAFFSMNIFDALFWALAAFLVLRLIKTELPQYWVLLGLVLGLGMLNKIGVSWLAIGIYTAILLTSQRRWLWTRWPWICGLIAALLFLPYIYWNFAHDFAHLEFIRNATGGKYSLLTPWTFLIGQIPAQNPVTFPFWLAGLVYFFVARDGKNLRVLGWMYLVPLVILILNQHSKPDYLSPAYAWLFAGGGVALERWRGMKPLRWLTPVCGTVLVLGLIFAPIVLPILPVETFIRYSEALGIKPYSPENKRLSELHQFYADMFGWEEKAKEVARVYNSLTPDEKIKCAIFADNYGRCGAIDFFGKAYGLPRSIGKHNNYWIWGPREYTGELMIVLGGDLEDKKEKFESVEVAGVATCKYCMPYESDLKVYVCRKLKVSLKDSWPRLKSYG
jgi:hypothetical protein